MNATETSETCVLIGKPLILTAGAFATKPFLVRLQESFKTGIWYSKSVLCLLEYLFPRPYLGCSEYM